MTLLLGRGNPQLGHHFFMVITAHIGKLGYSYWQYSSNTSVQSSKDGMFLLWTKNLLSVSQLTSSSHYNLFGLFDVKGISKYKNFRYTHYGRRRLKSVYVLSTESAYVNKTRRNKTVGLWHALLGYVSYH